MFNALNLKEMNEQNNRNTTLQVLNQSELCGRQFTVYGTAEQPLFLAKDIAEVIEHTNVTKMTLALDPDEKLIARANDSLGRENAATFLTEDGLYEVLMQSRKPIAKEFKKGVKTILKEIRTKGGYIATTPDETPEMIMAKAVKIADERIKAQAAQIDDLEYQLTEAQNTIELKQDAIESYSKQIAKQRPIVEYAQEVLKSDATYTFTQVAKMLGLRNVHLLTDWLCRHKIIYRQSGQWLPKAGFTGTRLFAMRTVPFVRKDGTVGSSTYTVVTEAGRKFLFETTRIVPVVEE